MLPRLHNPNIWDNYFKSFMDYYRSILMTLYRKNWKREDYYELSYYQYVISQYWYALYLVVLIKYEVLEGINTEWSYYIDKYELEDKRKKLACNSISLKKILEIFELPTLTTSSTEGTFDNVGIESDIIEDDFIVENTEDAEELDTVEILTLVNTPTLLSNYITEKIETY
jgi:hypothetical protein